MADLLFGASSCSSCTHTSSENISHVPCQAGASASSYSDQHFCPDGLPLAAVQCISLSSSLSLALGPRYHRPLRSHPVKQPAWPRTQTVQRLPARRLCVTRAELSARGLRPAGRKQKPEQWRNRLGKITHCCLYLQPVCAGCWWVNRGNRGLWGLEERPRYQPPRLLPSAQDPDT